MDIQTIVETYYQGWATRDQALARSVMADTMTHGSVHDHFASSDEFLTQCWSLADGAQSVRYIKSIFTEQEAFVILEWTFQQGKALGAEYLRLQDGKIQEVMVVNSSPTDLRTILNI